VAMICPSSGYVQGDGRISWHWDASEFSVQLKPQLRLPFTGQIRAREHVCRDIGRGRCSQEPTAGPVGSPAYGYPPAQEQVSSVNSSVERDAFPPRGSRRLAPR